MNEIIQIWKTKNKKGVFISKQLYSQLSEFIMEKLKNTDCVTLVELIEKVNEEVFKDTSGNGACWLLNVKQDMEVLGLINVKKLPDRTQIITLKRTGKKTMLLKVRQRSANAIDC